MSESSNLKSNKDKNIVKCPELEFFDKEEESDVVFMVNGRPLYAEKRFLAIRNEVFRGMFLGKFDESKDKEVVINDTTFDAFKTLIQFLYTDQLVLKDRNDIILIEEVYRQSDKYFAYRLKERIVNHLMTVPLCLRNIKVISTIAYTSENQKLSGKVMKYLEDNFNDFIRDGNQLIEINDSTHNKLCQFLANEYERLNEQLMSYKAIICSECLQKHSEYRSCYFCHFNTKN